MRKLWPFLAAMVAIFALVISVPFLLQPDHYRAQLAEALSGRFHHKVIIGRLSLGYFPPLLFLHDVSMLNDTQDKPLVQVEEVDALLSMADLLHAHVVPQALVLHHAQFTLHRLANGNWAWNEWMPDRSVSASFDQWPLHTVEVHDSQVHLIDPWASAPQQMDLESLEAQWTIPAHQWNATGTLSPLPVPMQWTWQGKTLNGWSGELVLSKQDESLRVNIQPVPEGWSLHGQADVWPWADAVALARFAGRWNDSGASDTAAALKNWILDVTVTASSTTFSEAGELSGGKTEIKGNVLRAAGAPMFLTAEWAFQNVPSSVVESSLGFSSGLSGSLTGLGQFEVTCASDAWSHASGRGYLEVTEGKYHWSDALSEHLAKAHILRYLAKKYPDYMQYGLPVHKADAHWDMAHGMATIRDGLLDMGNVRAAWAGTVDVVRQAVDAYVRVQIIEKSASLINEIPSAYVDSSLGHTRILPMNGHLQGALNAWHLKALSGSKVPASTRSRLIKTLK